MRLTTKGRFAVTAMIDLGLHQTTGPVTLAAISQRQKISMSYLEQMFSKLRRHELVASTRGPGGGYSLGRKAERITVADIVFAVDAAESAPAKAAGEEEGARCTAHELWASLNSRMVEFLDSVTLQHLMEEQLARNAQLAKSPAVVRHATSRQSAPSVARPSSNVPNSVFALGSKALAKS